MKKITQKRLTKHTGFSLIELSVILAVVSIVIAGMLSVSVSSAMNDKSEITKEHIDKIYNAMGAYLLQNGTLPCPAPITAVKSTATTYGDSTGTPGTCHDEDGVYEHNNFAYGMVPVQDLGISSEYAQDGYGNKFGYLVYTDFTTDTTFGDASYSSGIEVENKTVTLLDSGELAVFAIISYGANKSGAFNDNSATQNGLSDDTAEKANYPTKTGPAQITLPTDTITFVESTSSPDTITLQASATDTSTIFDDVIFFKSRNDLVRDFHALNLIRCPAIVAANTIGDNYYLTYDSDTTYMDFDSGRYNQITISNTECPSGWDTTVMKPGRRCGAYGVWELPAIHNGDTLSIAIPCTE